MFSIYIIVIYSYLPIAVASPKKMFMIAKSFSKALYPSALALRPQDQFTEHDVILRCDLDIGGQELPGAPLPGHVVRPPGAEDVLHVGGGQLGRVREPGRVPPQGGLGSDMRIHSS